MKGKFGLSFLLVLGLACASYVQAVEVSNFADKINSWDGHLRNEQVCTMCEQFTSQAVEYLSQNKTETEILDDLHKACSRLHSFEQQCTLLVDYYAPLFFMEIGLIKPEAFCTKVNLCDGKVLIRQTPLVKTDDSCTVCHNAIAEILIKLKDPDTQLEIIESLLKVCNKVEHFTQQCKRIVFEYGPVILVNAEKFIETVDICVYIHACKTSHNGNTLELSHQEASSI